MSLGAPTGAEGAAIPPPVATTCPYCGVGCGVLATRTGPRALAVAGDPAHPSNHGRLCSKGLALGETVGVEGRLLRPEIGGRPAGWDEVLALVAARFAQTIRSHGPDAVAFYVSGQLLTEDYYVANKLMKGFIGSANIDTNSRLCMASTVAGHRRAFGSDTVPGRYEDLELADLVVLVGSNLAWCHPVLWQRLLAARAARPGLRVVVLDPRVSATAAEADLHLPLAPGSDVAVFLGLLDHLRRGGHVAADWVAAHVEGAEAAFAEAAGLGLAGAAAASGLAAGTLAAFYDEFAATRRVVTVFSQGVNQSAGGTDKVNAILNCHLATARIGRPGMGPFSVTGQPNAMGGREVGGLATLLAAHMELDDPAHRARVQRFWGAPTLPTRPGLKAVDLFRAVAEGRVRALWIMATNPAASLPDSAAVNRALAACPFVVVSDVMRATDTTRHAHVLLPAAAWAEKDGTVTSSERVISRQRRVFDPPGAARPDWAIIAEVGRRMGWEAAFAWTSPAEVFREHAALSALDNAGARAFDLGAHAAITLAEYEALAPFAWPARPGGRGEDRFFADGQFHTPDGRARMVATPAHNPDAVTTAARPFLLNTGRVRDHWHTMTRTGLSPRLSRHLGEPYVEISPADARALGIRAAQLVRVRGGEGTLLARAVITEGQPPGQLFAPIHWTGTHSAAGLVAAVLPARCDPVSGQPALKAGPVALEPAPMAWFAYAVLPRSPACPPAAYWALAAAPAGVTLELAGTAPPADWAAETRALFGLDPAVPLHVLEDRRRGVWRAAAVADGRLAGLLFVAPEPVALDRAWLSGRLADPDGARAPWTLLAGRPPGPATGGAVVCACTGAASGAIRAAIAAGAGSLAALGDATGAGTGCGSCRADLMRILDDVRRPQPV